MELTVARRTYRPEIAALNAVVGLGERCGLPFTRLDVEGMLRAARRRERLEDWGDEAFLPRFRRLMEAAAAAPLTPLARLVTREACIKAVGNRLRWFDWVRRHPEVAETRLEAPIFILGFPRTGTTLLQNLLCLAPGRRALRFHELMNPVPLRDDPAADLRVRRRRTAGIVRAAYAIAPEQGSIHAIGVDTMEECWPLFFNSFAVMNYDLAGGMEDFGDWMMTQDMVGPYREYRAQLQLLSAGRPAAQLLLKCPEHLWNLDALFAVFPDARVVWTHRDPVASVASYSSLVSLNFRMLYGHFDPVALGDHVARRLRFGVERAMDARARIGDESRFFDVDFQALQADPVGMVHRIQQHFGEPVTAAHTAAMEGFLAAERADAKGKHRYSAEAFGLSRPEIEASYARYITRFGILPARQAG